jgi:RES domain-containing protein
VLTAIADDEDLDLVFELDNATNARLQAEEAGLPGIMAKELVFHVPFTHANPLGARFSTPFRGAWYAAFELATAKAEVIFHKSVEFSEIDWKEREEIGYDDYLADFTAPFHDLRNLDSREIKEEVLSPTSYVRSQQLAVDLMEKGSLGVIYPSVRHQDGTCVACFRPAVVSNVRKDVRYKLIWTPLRARMIRQDGATQ